MKKLFFEIFRVKKPILQLIQYMQECEDACDLVILHLNFCVPLVSRVLSHTGAGVAWPHRIALACSFSRLGNAF